MAQRSVFAPGIDHEPGANGAYVPDQGAGGVFASILQGSTPKYALNDPNTPGRPDFFRNTMARMFIRIDPDELPLFERSVTDDHTRNRLVNRLVGDPTPPTDTELTLAGTTSDTSQARAARRRIHAVTNGYLDFVIQNVQMAHQEKVQVSETLADNYVAYAFGQSPPVWNFAGALINSVQDDQASNMYRLYTEILRATQLARRQKSLSLSFDSYVVTGVMMNLTMALSATNELVIPFSFQLLVKRVFITNYTAGWVPTTAGTPFAADPLARDFDRVPREEGLLLVPHVTTPPATTEVAPVPGAAPNANAPELSHEARVAAESQAIQNRLDRTVTDLMRTSEALYANEATRRGVSVQQVADEFQLRIANSRYEAAEAAYNTSASALDAYNRAHPHELHNPLQNPDAVHTLLSVAVNGGYPIQVDQYGNLTGGTEGALNAAQANRNTAEARLLDSTRRGIQAAATPPAPTPTPPVL